MKTIKYTLTVKCVDGDELSFFGITLSPGAREAIELLGSIKTRLSVNGYYFNTDNIIWVKVEQEEHDLGE